MCLVCWPWKVIPWTSVREKAEGIWSWSCTSAMRFIIESGVDDYVNIFNKDKNRHILTTHHNFFCLRSHWTSPKILSALRNTGNKFGKKHWKYGSLFELLPQKGFYFRDFRSQQENRIYRKYVFGLLALKSDPLDFCTREGRGNLILESGKRCSWHQKINHFFTNLKCCKEYFFV